MQYIKLPNKIFDYKLNSTELMVYVAIKRYSNVLAFCAVKHETIAKLLDVSTDTISRAVGSLESKGLISVKIRYNSSGYRIANGYTLFPMRSSYTKIPANIFSYKLPKSVFKVYAYLLKCRDNKTLIAVPSLNEMATNLNMSKRTIVDAVRYLDDNAIIYKARYNRKTDRRIGRNRHVIFTTSLKAVLLSMVIRFRNVQKKMRADPHHKAALTIIRNLLKPISISNISQIVLKIKWFLRKRLYYFLI